MGAINSQAPSASASNAGLMPSANWSMLNGNQSGNKILASPADGSAGAGVWRALAAADIPAIATITGSIAESQVTGLSADLSARLLKASNLSDLAGVSTARTNLGLGSAATLNANNAANNIPLLDSSGLLATSVLPPLSISKTSVVASQVAMLALTAEQGDVAVRSDMSKTYILAGTDPTVLGNWQELLGAGEAPVQSVAGRTGTVVLTSSDVGLSNLSNNLQLVAASNLSDLASASTARSNLGLGTSATQASSAFDASGTTATHAALTTAHGSTNLNTALAIVQRDGSGNFSAGTITATLNGTISGSIAESQVTNLSTDLSAKAPLASPALTGAPTAPTATAGTNTTQLATTAFVLANSSATVTSVTSANGLSLSSGVLSFSGASYSPVAGSSSIATVGTIASGTWNGGVIGGTYGGTGTNNGSATLSITGSASISGTNTGDQTIPAAATPSGSIGLAAVAGTATSFTRSDGTAALSQSIAPTWTGQHIHSLNGALSTPPIKLNGTWVATGGTATTTKPQFLIEPSAATSTGWSTSGTGLGINGPSGFAGNLIDLQANGVSKVSVTGGGKLVLAASTNSDGTIVVPNGNGLTIASDATSTFRLLPNGSDIYFQNSSTGNIYFTGQFAAFTNGIAIYKTGGIQLSNASAVTTLSLDGPTGSITLVGGANIIASATTGTKIGTGTTQKIGFWNATPIVQPTVTGAKGSNAALASLLTALANMGLVVDSSTA